MALGIRTILMAVKLLHGFLNTSLVFIFVAYLAYTPFCCHCTLVHPIAMIAWMVIPYITVDAHLSNPPPLTLSKLCFDGSIRVLC